MLLLLLLLIMMTKRTMVVSMPMCCFAWHTLSCDLSPASQHKSVASSQGFALFVCRFGCEQVPGSKLGSQACWPYSCFCAMCSPLTVSEHGCEEDQHACVCICLSLSLSLSLCLSIFYSACLPACLSLRPSVCRSVCLSVCLSVRLFVCLFVLQYVVLCLCISLSVIQLEPGRLHESLTSLSKSW